MKVLITRYVGNIVVRTNAMVCTTSPEEVKILSLLLDGEKMRQRLSKMLEQAAMHERDEQKKSNHQSGSDVPQVGVAK